MLKHYCIFLFVLTCNFTFAGSDDDSLHTHHDHDHSYTHVTKRAAILSAVLPGSGQIYNEIGYRKIPHKKHRAWWKAPLIYGGLAACGYYFYHNNKYAALTKQEWQKRNDNPDLEFYDARFANYTSLDELINGNSTANTIGYQTYANRRDLFIFGFIGVWGLNVIEAYVDAHFVTFDVSEDLSFSWAPTVLANQHAGLSLRLNFE